MAGFLKYRERFGLNGLVSLKNAFAARYFVTSYSRRSPRLPGLRSPWWILAWRRCFFTKPVRAEVWQLLADILDSGAQISPTLEAMAEAYRAQGRHVVAAVLLDLRAAIPRVRFNERIRDYAGSSEQIILMGFGEVDPAQMFRSAARLLRMDLAIRSAIWSAVALPVLLLAGLIGIVLLFGLQLYPSLSGIVDFETLPVFQQWVIAIVTGFCARPWIPAVIFTGIVTGLAIALPRWSGPGRVFADRMVPFSLARLQIGAGFLFAVIEHGRSGQAVTARLFRQMADVAQPYAASRIRAIADCYVAAGANLGAAAMMAGQGFPAPELGVILKMLWNEQDGIERAGVFTDRWLGRIEASLRARMMVLNGALLTLIALALIILMSVALPIVNQLTGELYG